MMTKLDDWYAVFLKRSDLLSPSARIALVASIAERLFPNYVAFGKMCNFGEPQLLRDSLNSIWNAALRPQEWSDDKKLDDEMMNRLAPLSDDFTCILVTSAQYAVGAVYSAGMVCSQPRDFF